MAKSRNSAGPADRPERRSGEDRRRLDNGPPGTRDRRRLVEPRKPEVAEIEVSPAEWEALRRAVVPPEPAGREHADDDGDR